MDVAPPFARVAMLIGDPARALMLAALMDGRSRTAGELASEAQITPQTASAHLAKLAEAGLLAIEKQGRHRYHRLGSSEVAHALEAMMAVPAPPQRPRRLGPSDTALRRARVCYDHMAGEIAVALAARWVAIGWIVEKEGAWALTAAGSRGVAALEIPLPAGHRRRPPVRPCLDWSERRHHMGGQLGAALLEALLSRGWARQRRGSRVLLMSTEGERALAKHLDETAPMLGQQPNA